MKYDIGTEWTSPKTGFRYKIVGVHKENQTYSYINVKTGTQFCRESDNIEKRIAQGKDVVPYKLGVPAQQANNIEAVIVWPDLEVPQHPHKYPIGYLFAIGNITYRVVQHEGKKKYTVQSQNGYTTTNVAEETITYYSQQIVVPKKQAICIN